MVSFLGDCHTFIIIKVRDSREVIAITRIYVFRSQVTQAHCVRHAGIKI